MSEENGREMNKFVKQNISVPDGQKWEIVTVSVNGSLPIKAAFADGSPAIVDKCKSISFDVETGIVTVHN